MTKKSEGTLVDGLEDREGGLARRSPWPWWRSPWLYGLGALVVFNLIYALPRYLSFDPVLSRTRIDPGFALHYPVVVAHVVAGNVALVTVFVQLLPWVRRHRPGLHRISGRVYVFAGALPASLLSLVLLPYSTAPMGKLGLATMAVLWIATSLAGLRAARQRRYVDHRRWMVYSFALAMGTSWGRVISQFAIPGNGIDVAVFFDISSWMGWVVSLVAAYLWLERTTPRRRVPAGR
ncbi:DUF2306 domain-containing protein [Streptosporangium sp. NPDC000239]|uniref:DUF2306 domain-containing protein n=1 Tax=unclassified Streptosporangium TaxID=2632669 RepID=UPI003326C947